MKKIKLLLLSTVLSMCVYSQSSVYKISKVTTMVYDDYWSKWYASDSSYPNQMYAFFDKKKIKITDRVNSNYVVYGEPEVDSKNDYTAYSWTAVDEEQRDCMIILKKFLDYNDNYYDKSYLFVMYKKIAFMYLIEKDK